MAKLKKNNNVPLLDRAIFRHSVQVVLPYDYYLGFVTSQISFESCEISYFFKVICLRCETHELTKSNVLLFQNVLLRFILENEILKFENNCLVNEIILFSQSAQ